MTTLDPGGEVENNARFECAHVHSGRENRLRHQDQVWPWNSQIYSKDEDFPFFLSVESRGVLKYIED
jgi:hypothetical protein